VIEREGDDTRMLCTDNLFQDLRLRIPYLQRNFARARQHVARMVQRAQAMIRSDQISGGAMVTERSEANLRRHSPVCMVRIGAILAKSVPSGR
jgi:hypothetical protein